MRISNDRITIKMGKKKYDFQNLILDSYLKKMVESQQTDDITKWCPPTLSRCFVKFDTKLDFNKSSILKESDFDIFLGVTSIIENTSNGGTNVNYQYSLSNTDTWKNYVNRKITTLGFADLSNNFYACLDCSNYSLTIKQNEDISIARTDTFKTDSNFYSNNSTINYPVHLSIRGIPSFITQGTEDYPQVGKYAYAHLSSIGLGTNKNSIKKEIQLNSDNTTYTDNSIIFKELANGKVVEGLLYPNSIIQPSSTKFPTKTDDLYTYLFFKFKIFHILSNFMGEYIAQDSGYWYTLSVPIYENGVFNYSIKYERM